jgi:zinc/manganese transport system substrate-binding protein
MKRIACLAAVVLLAFSSIRAEARPLDVVASFSVLGEIVKEVAGDKADVHTLVGPDGDAHSFEPTPNDARTLGSADLVIVNGLGLEKWMERLIEASGYKGTVAVASRGVQPRLMIEEGASVTDPHAWQDLANGRLYVRNIAAALAAADPADRAYFDARAKSYDAALAALDAWVRQEVARVPPARRRVITTHDAFGYFGAAYGVTFLAPEGISTDAEPSAGDLARLIDQIRREKIRALFLENITSPGLMRTISQETGTPLGGSLFSDALSPPGGPAPTYAGMFKNNLPKLVDGMQKN